MNKIIFMSILSALCLHANQIQDYYYNEGYENGFQQGLLKGQEVALESAKKIIERYKARIKSYEIGKYLIANKNLTAPQIYQKINGNKFEIIVLPSKIEKELDIEAIFNEFGSVPELEQPSETNTNTNILNSIVLQEKDLYNNKGILSKPSEKTSTNKLTLKKNSKTKEILQSANVSFVETKNNFEVIFFTKEERKEFCESFKVCN